MLVDYGEEFPDFLATFEPAAELPYLSDVARLDRFWTQAHVAADQTPIAAADIDGISHHTRLHEPCCARTLRALEMVRRPTDLFAVAVQSRTTRTRMRLRRSCGAVKALCWSDRMRPSRRSNCPPAAARSSTRVLPAPRLSDASLVALDVEHDIDLSALMAQLLHAGAFAEIRQ